MIFERSVRLLACDFDIAVDCEGLAGRLDRRLQNAAQHYPVSRRHRFDVRRVDGGYRIHEDGVERETRPWPEGAASVVLFRMHQLACAALPGFVGIHAGCASWRSRRFLAVGPAQSGKTTLMTRLLYEGFSVYGDELVLIRDGQALPYPRRFGVRPATADLVPQIATHVAGTGAGATVTLDPSLLGFGWNIEPGPVAALLFLEANHDGPSELRPCPKPLMAHRVMAHSSAPGLGARQWFAETCAIVAAAGCYTLRVGHLPAAVEAIRAILEQ